MLVFAARGAISGVTPLVGAIRFERDSIACLIVSMSDSGGREYPG